MLPQTLTLFKLKEEEQREPRALKKRMLLWELGFCKSDLVNLASSVNGIGAAREIYKFSLRNLANGR